ncbi:MAG: ABC transporter substrate-binding protein [Magnetospirillum sp.]
MRKEIVLGLVLSAALFASPARAQSHLDRIKAQGEVRVCIWPDYYSITYRNTRTGALEGIDIDMAKELAKDLGVKLTFVDSSFRTLIADLSEDKCDVSMHGIGITPARQEKLDFTQPHLRSGVYAITSKNNQAVSSWQDIDKPGVIVAAQAGTFMVDVMKAELKQATLSVVATPEAREQEVMAGRADLFVTDYPYSRKMLARHDWAKLLAPPQPLAPTSYAYAINKGDQEWLATLDSFVARTKKDGRLLKAAINNGLEAIVVKD